MNVNVTREFQFLPIATLTQREDGTFVLEIDWSSSATGEWFDEAAEHRMTPGAEDAAEILDAWRLSLPDDGWTGRAPIPVQLPDGRPWPPIRGR